ncbi:MAG: hypothetical protein ACRD16_13135 [Thermoanaerobaculia bacterium]
MTGAWKRLGEVDPKGLSAARLEIHHAAQVVSAIGITHLPHRPDDSHTNLEWMPVLEAFGGNLVSGPRPFRGALRPADFTLMLLEEDGWQIESLSLQGKTLDTAYGWMSDAIGRATGPPARALVRPSYELPDHSTLKGGRFSDPMESFHEMGRWYGDAASLLLVLMAELSSEASPVRCWPHHFDIALLLTLGEGRTIGLGLSPGDAGYAEPYWYVTPYPYPKNPALPPLPEKGRWHTEGFFAAVLTGSDLVAGDSSMQRQRSETFLRAALSACRAFSA